MLNKIGRFHLHFQIPIRFSPQLTTMDASLKRKLEEEEEGEKGEGCSKGGDGGEGSSKGDPRSKAERLARMNKWRNALEKVGGYKALGLINGNIKVNRDGDHVEFYGVGTLLDAPGLRWVAGEGFKPWAVVEKGRWLVCTPPFVSRITKAEAENMSNKTLAKVKKEPMKMVYDAMVAGGVAPENILKIKTVYKKKEKQDDDDLGDKQPGASASTS